LIEFKPGAVAKGEGRALALAYVDSREYMARLDAVDPSWSDNYQVLEGATVVCRLTVEGVTRTDLGRKDEADENSLTSAAAQAFKRACTKFGLGRYLYGLPQTWAEFDPQRKRFTPAALDSLRESLKRPGTPPAGNAQHPSMPGNGSERARPEPRNGNGGPKTAPDSKPKPAVVKTSEWAAAAKALAERYPHFVNSAGQPDFALMTMAAGASGYFEITDANLAQVIAALELQVAVTA
jgi:hypothetical protein